MRRPVGLFLLCIAVACGFSQAQTTSGLNAPQLFEKGMNALVGSRATQSGFDALEYFRRSADLGYAPAQVVLGYFYDTGTFAPKEPGQALSWYKKAAQQDDPLAQWLAGRIVYEGTGQARDLNEASTLLQQSAEHGNPFGQYLLGAIKLERQKYSDGAELMRKAAEQGLPQAQLQWALLLRDGRGVPQDKFESYVWMLLSTRAGHRAAVGNDLQALEADLGTNETEHAKSRSLELEGSATRAVAAHGCTGWPGEFAVMPTPPPPDLQRFCR